MKNKKVIIAIVIVVVLIVAIIAGILIFKPFDKKEDKKEEDKTEKITISKVREKNNKEDEEKEVDNDNVDYEAILEKFIDACKSEKDMNAFIEKYVDIKSLYVEEHIRDSAEFMKVYNETKEKDYENYIDDVKKEYSDFLFDDDESLEIMQVDSPIKMSAIGRDIWNDVRFTAESPDGYIYKLAAIFCDDKLVTVLHEDDIDALYDSAKDDAYDSSNTTNSTSSLGERFNTIFNSYFDGE